MPFFAKALTLLLALLLLAAPAVARAQFDDDRVYDDDEVPESEWLGPAAGDFELGLSGDVGHLFTAGVTGFALQVNFGYFFTDWLEGGVAASVGHNSTIEPDDEGEEPDYPDFDDPLPQALSDGASPPVGRHQAALTSGPVAETAFTSSWFGSSEIWMRLYPFKPSRALPETLAPFFNVEFGAIYARHVTPYLNWTASIGMLIHLTEQVALTPEIGYSLVRATCCLIEFGGSKNEHVLSANWGLSFFFLPNI